MLYSLDGKKIARVPHVDDFKSLVKSLGDDRVEEVRRELVQVVDEMEPDAKRGSRVFSSSHLGSELSPWAYPLKHLYDLACKIEGDAAGNEAIESRAGLIFGLFVWESIMARKEKWVFYDPNLSSADPNREVTGKVYFESIT